MAANLVQATVFSYLSYHRSLLPGLPALSLCPQQWYIFYTAARETLWSIKSGYLTSNQDLPVPPPHPISLITWSPSPHWSHLHLLSLPTLCQAQGTVTLANASAWNIPPINVSEVHSLPCSESLHNCHRFKEIYPDHLFTWEICPFLCPYSLVFFPCSMFYVL